MPELEDRIRRYADAAVHAVPPITVEDLRPPAPPPSTTVRLLTIAALVLALVGVAASFSIDDGGSEVVATVPSEFPLTLDGHVAWQLATLNGDADVTEEVYEQRYSKAFRDAVPLSEFRSVGDAGGLRELGPWRILREVERRGDEVLAVQLGARSGEQLRLTIQRRPDGRLDASTILRAEACADALDPTVPLAPALAGQFEWVMTSLLAGGTPPSDAELSERFAASFLSAVPPPQLREALDRITGLGPYTLRSFEGQPTDVSLAARLGVRTGEEARLTLSVSPADPQQITGLVVRTQPPCRL